MAQKRPGATKGKLLAAASDVFFEKGFRDATVAEICKRAGANIAAVNYYFGSKESLYQQAWHHAFAESIKAHPLDGGVSPTAPAEARLRGQVKALMERIGDGRNRDFFISQMEFIHPTGLLEDVMKSALIPLRQRTLSVVRELLGPEATVRQVEFCEICIISLCFNPLLIQRMMQRGNAVEVPEVIGDLGSFTEHLMTFALAGIAAIKRDCPPKALADGSSDARESNHQG